MKKRVTVQLNDEVYDKFRYYCRRHGFKISQRLEMLMDTELEQEHVQKYKKVLNMFKDAMNKCGAQIPMKSERILVPHKPPLNVVKEDSKVHLAKRKTPSLDQLRYRLGL